jgi:hypothetical protein
MAKTGPMNRRQALSLMIAAVAAPATALPRPGSAATGGIVVIDGWVLLAADVAEISRHAD